jgi:hypothetical protein
MRIAILVSFTSKNCDYKEAKDFIAFSTLLPSLKQTVGDHDLTLYLGYDTGDTFPDDTDLNTELANYGMDYRLVEIKNPRHSCCVVWNELFRIAVHENNDYYFQCGDDVVIDDPQWANKFISKLQENYDIGVAGGYGDNVAIITQLFVSQKHWDIFNYFFDSNFTNWWSDDWVNQVYKPYYLYWLKDVPINNSMKAEETSRYKVDMSEKKFLAPAVRDGQIKLLSYLLKNTPVDSAGVQFLLQKLQTDTTVIDESSTVHNKSAQYQSMYEMALLAKDWDTKRKYLMNALESQYRVEPLVRMAEYYRSAKNINMMYVVLKMACSLEDPLEDSEDPLEDLEPEQNIDDYDYLRWHLMSICAFHTGKYDEGRDAAQLAYLAKGRFVDEYMLNTYDTRQKFVEEGTTMEQYIAQRTEEEKVEDPDKYTEEWKSYCI